MRRWQKSFLLLLLLCGPASAAPPERFTFTKVLDISSFGVLGGSLNHRGTVAVTLTSAAGDVVLVGDGRTLSIVAETTSPRSFGRAAITHRGDVIFSEVSREGRRLLLSRRGMLSTLIDVDASFADPVVNEHGTVAYSTFLETGVRAIVSLEHGKTTIIATHPRALLPFDINQRGQVLALTDPGRPTSSVLIVGDGRTIRTVADLEVGFVMDAVINDKGTVAFSAFLGDAGRRIYLADTRGGMTPLLTSDGPFELFSLVGLTNSGTLVFTATLDTGEQGVFVGPDPVADKVIATGDTLDGATVAGAVVVDVNASGQLLLWVIFEDGRRVLYRTQHGGVH